MEYSTEKIPTWALCYFINSDPSGLDDEEIEMVDKWCDENKISVVSTVTDQEYFTCYPAFGLPTDVIDCHVIVY